MVTLYCRLFWLSTVTKANHPKPVVVTLLISLQFGWVLARTAHLCWGWRLHFQDSSPTKWFRLPQSMVARFQEGVFQEKEVGAASFLRSGPGNW